MMAVSLNAQVSIVPNHVVFCFAFVRGSASSAFSILSIAAK